MRRGGAEALRSTAPPWLLLGLGTGQVPGKLGAQVSLLVKVVKLYLKILETFNL